MVKAKKNPIFSDFNQVQSRSISKYFSSELNGESVINVPVAACYFQNSFTIHIPFLDLLFY